MAGIADSATVVSDGQVGVMILLVRDLSDDIYECHGLVIVFKGVPVPDAFFFSVELPWRGQLPAESYDVFPAECTIFGG